MRRACSWRGPVTGLAAALLLIGGGMLLPRKAVSGTADKPAVAGVTATAPAAVTAEEVADTFQGNEALADERFRVKPVAVSGRLNWIRRAGQERDGRTRYALVLGPDHVEAGVRITFLSFRFTDDARHELAALRPGRQVTVSGTFERFVPEGNPTVYFRDCKLVRTVK
jgi:hypothetical protein